MFYDADARCYSAVLYANGVTPHIVNAGSGFFRFYASSPLVRELSSIKILNGEITPKKGDVIAVGSNKSDAIPVDHVAVFENNNVIFQKVSPMVETPFNLLTFSSFKKEWAPITSNFKFFRPVQTMANYIEQNQTYFSGEMKKSLNVLTELQRKVSEFNLIRREDPAHPDNKTSAYSEKYYFDYHNAVKSARDKGYKIEKLADQRMKELQADTSGSNAKTIKLFFWEYIFHMARDTSSYQGPYD